ncbi:bifunctional metallophosphatase/5'-nucleotidase [Streptomyces sp. AJS327]|nr:bifunctional metallophosphatase/5'-nucleotidase [Streptomyces sp. AJS327]
MVAALSVASAPAHAEDRTTPVQLLAVNDLHGNLDPAPGPAGAITRTGVDGRIETVPAGGVARLATLLESARADAGTAHSLTVAVGDMIGGSPLLSAAYHDEPTVEALEALDLAVSSVGNHEFDEGVAELLRIDRGGCHPEDGCADPQQPYDGADFPYLAANVLPRAGAGTARGSAREPILPPYWIKRLPSGERIGFVGLTSRDTQDALSASKARDLVFQDEVRTIDRYAAELDRRGVRAIVALLHEGGTRAGRTYDADCDARGPASELTGRAKDIAARVSPKVDMFVTGHTHEPFVCTLPDPAGEPRLITQAASFSRTYTDVRFELDRESGELVRPSARARNHVVTGDTPGHEGVSRVVETWRKRSATVANEPVGHIAEDIPGRGSDRPETPLGDLVSDAQVAATREQGAQLALLNWGGVRADLVHRASGREGDGVVTHGEAFQVQPFENPLVTMDLTGEQLLAVLRQQFSGSHADSPEVLQPSGALRYEADTRRSGADRLLTDTVRVAGEPVRGGDTYRVTVNEFLAEGGNGFSVLTEGTRRETGPSDLTALVDYLRGHSSPGKPLRAPAADRVTWR